MSASSPSGAPGDARSSGSCLGEALAVRRDVPVRRIGREVGHDSSSPLGRKRTRSGSAPDVSLSSRDSSRSRSWSPVAGEVSGNSAAVSSVGETWRMSTRLKTWLRAVDEGGRRSGRAACGSSPASRPAAARAGVADVADLLGHLLLVEAVDERVGPGGDKGVARRSHCSSRAVADGPSMGRGGFCPGGSPSS